VIEQVAPPSILVDENYRVIHLSDNAGRYLNPAGGPLSSDITELARPELRFELRSALHRVFEQNQPTVSVPIPVQFNGAPRRVHLFVKPGENGNPARHAIVMFIEGEAIEDNLLPLRQHSSDETVRRLTHELEVTQARLRTVREESDVATEELRAANEELQSINEEYHLTSEELETSKEELQSINEELQTVNSELKLKLEAISRAHSDLQNLMAATDVGTLFLDSNLRIKRFTDQVTSLICITSADEGRPITDFAHQLEYDKLVDDAQAVLAHLMPIRRTVHSSTDRWYDIRLRPYRTVDDRIDGVVITFVDMTERQQIEEALRESERQLRQQKRLVELSRDPIFIWDFDDGIIEWNRGCEELYGYTSEEVLGKEKDQLLGTTLEGSSFAEVKAKLLSDGSWRGELHHRAKDGRVLTVETQLDLESLDGRRLVLESTRDVTERKLLEERQQLLLGELTHRVKNMLAVIQSMAYQTLRYNSSGEEFSGEEFIERFTGRLHAMANAHELLVQTEWKGADLASLARVQLEAYAPDADRLHIKGPPVLLPASLSTPFGLVLHELATNAAKYGSLSLATGTVSVSWTLSDRDGRQWLALVWREEGGPAVQEPARHGLGSTLIEHAISGAAVRREFHPQGLVCTIEVALPRKEGFSPPVHGQWAAS
jgi:two-component system CheB/CheR fusion protein